MTIWVLGGDPRSRYAAEYLQKNGHLVNTYGVPQCEDTPLPKKICCAILPFPSFSGVLLQGKSAIPVEDVLDRVGNSCKIFGGLLQHWQDRFAAQGAKTYDLYGAEPLTTLNAVPTAEGAICLAIEHSPITLDGSNCLIIGHGRCGRALAQRLLKLNANVTISSRTPEKLAYLKRIRKEVSGVWQYGLGAYDFIFNTVPTTVISFDRAMQISPDCLVIELASLPGGIAEDAKKHLNYHFAPGLPGKFAPKTAGALYAKSILNLLEQEEVF